jgi:hypothetical protein
MVTSCTLVYAGKMQCMTLQRMHVRMITNDRVDEGPAKQRNWSDTVRSSDDVKLSDHAQNIILLEFCPPLAPTHFPVLQVAFSYQFYCMLGGMQLPTVWWAILDRTSPLCNV